jgi:hypothetical protein
VPRLPFRITVETALRERSKSRIRSEIGLYHQQILYCPINKIFGVPFEDSCELPMANRLTTCLTHTIRTCCDIIIVWAKKTG